MRITARYSGICADCRQRYAEGAEIEWDKATRRTVHAGACPAAPAVAAPIAVVRGGAKSSTRKTNRRAGACERCGDWLAVGAGELVWCCEDSGCMTHHDYSGYHVYCLDAAACNARRTERVAARKIEVAAAAARREALRAAVDGVLSIVKKAEHGWSGLIPRGDVESINLGRRAGGSETIYVTETHVIYDESSYDDGNTWGVERTADLDARVVTMRQVIQAQQARNEQETEL